MSNFTRNTLYKKQIRDKDILPKKNNDRLFILFLHAIFDSPWKKEVINISTT